MDRFNDIVMLLWIDLHEQPLWLIACKILVEGARVASLRLMLSHYTS